MNNVSLIGRLTKDPEISILNINGEEKQMAKYILAVETRNQTDFIPCSTIDKGAEWIKKNIRKGSRIGVVGSLKISNYEKSGIKSYKAEILVKEQYFA
ncbi:single-stranded DNA-binding protein [[Clostridium] colinum]|uniref:single-stranded DNA-binding protein n=1 Tax=[Clostridium] colinum TaxID=36835 RepID=UPI00202408FC|nr:single-stranded DNA-binding protein [[Clostridium] colinum]